MHMTPSRELASDPAPLPGGEWQRYDHVLPLMAAIIKGVWNDDDRPAGRDEDAPVPGRPPAHEDIPPIDHAPVPPLTEPDDTEGG